MEDCTRSFLSLEKVLLNDLVGCVSDVKSNKQAVQKSVPIQREIVFPETHHSGRVPSKVDCLKKPTPIRKEIICPQPCRPTRVPCIVDGLNSLCCKPKSSLPGHRGDLSLGVLNIFLSKDDVENELDGGSSQRGFFCGSPPVRTSNPLIHDVQFVPQTSMLASSLGTSHGGKASPTRVDRAPSCGNSLGGKPKIRIEGFACGTSESRCIVLALA